MAKNIHVEVPQADTILGLRNSLVVEPLETSSEMLVLETVYKDRLAHPLHLKLRSQALEASPFEVLPVLEH